MEEESGEEKSLADPIPAQPAQPVDMSYDATARSRTLDSCGIESATGDLAGITAALAGLEA